MAKAKKKRTKRYRGDDAKSPSGSTSPVVHHYQAVERSRPAQWWHDRRRTLRPLAIFVLVTGLLAWLLVELILFVF